MPTYRVKLQWTFWGKYLNPTPMESRIDDAIDAARQKRVKGHDGRPLARSHRHPESDGWHITWLIHGADADVRDMLTIWVGNDNVTVVEEARILTQEEEIYQRDRQLAKIKGALVSFLK